MQQFLRKAIVVFEGSESGFQVNRYNVADQDIRVEFQVEKSISSSQNKAEVRIWNLTENRRNSIGKELDNMRIEAGYIPAEGESNVGIIFSGQIRDVEHIMEGSDVITIVKSGDGDKAFKNSVISKTFPKGSSVKDVTEGIYEEFKKQGVKKGEWQFPDGLENFKRPYSICGACSREMNVLGKGKKFYWSIQNGTMEVIPSNGYLPGVVLLNKDSGLIGRPTITDNGVKATALINPEIRPNRTVKIESETLDVNGEDGIYRISKVRYSGSNRQGNFYVEIHGESLKDGKIDEGKR